MIYSYIIFVNFGVSKNKFGYIREYVIVMFLFIVYGIMNILIFLGNIVVVVL